MNPGSITDIPINSAQSDKILLNLSKASKRGKLILFLGAGASMNIDNRKPGWKTLAEIMVKEYKTKGKFKDPDGYTHCKSFLDKNSTDYKEVFTTLEKNNTTDF